MDKIKELTPVGVLQAVQNKDFLLKCLNSAKLDEDLLQDIADACEMSDLDALILASGMMEPAEAANKLFLMQDEAILLLKQCKQQCLKAGVNFGDGSVYVLGDKEDEKGNSGAPTAADKTKSPRTSAHGKLATNGVARQVSASPSKPTVSHDPDTSNQGQAGKTLLENGHSKPHMDLPKPQPPSLQQHPSQSGNTSPDVTSPTAPSTATEGSGVTTGVDSLIAVEPAHMPAVSSSARPPTAETSSISPTSQQPVSAQAAPKQDAQPAPQCTPIAVATPKLHAPQPGAATPSVVEAAPKSTPAPRPTSAPAPKSVPKPQTAPKPSPLSTPGPAAVATPSATPSSAASDSRPPRPQSAATPRVMAQSASRVQSAVAPKMERTPSYARPTAAFKAASMPRMPRTDDSTPLSERSTTLAGPGDGGTSPSGADEEARRAARKPVFDPISSSLLRPTKAFLAWTSGNSKEEREARASMAASQMLKPNSSSRGGWSTRSDMRGAGLQPSRSIKGATTTPEPFRLASAGRHQKAQEELARKIEEKRRKEGTYVPFKASSAPGSQRTTQENAPEAAHGGETTPQGPVGASRLPGLVQAPGTPPNS